MRKIIRTRAAKKVAEKLIPAEVALDGALSSITTLLATTIDARIEAELPLSCCQNAISGMSSVVGLISQARQELVAVHALLAEDKVRIGLREVSFGDSGGCPPMNAELDDSTNVVALVG